jgi:hypothetical protein
MMNEAETKAYNTISMLHSEALLENVILQQRLDKVSSRWYYALGYWIKRKLGLEKGYEV